MALAPTVAPRAKNRLAALAALSVLLVCGGAIPQNQARDAERDDARGAWPALDKAARPGAETPAQAPATTHVRVLTEQEKRCRNARDCPIEGACAPCDR